MTDFYGKTFIYTLFAMTIGLGVSCGEEIKTKNGSQLGGDDVLNGSNRAGSDDDKKPFKTALTETQNITVIDINQKAAKLAGRFSQPKLAIINLYGASKEIHAGLYVTLADKNLKLSGEYGNCTLSVVASRRELKNVKTVMASVELDIPLFATNMNTDAFIRRFDPKEKSAGQFSVITSDGKLAYNGADLRTVFEECSK